MSRNANVSISEKIREVGVHAVIYGFGSIAQSAVYFLLLPILTARLATAEFGAYSLIQMIAVVAGSIFYLGVTSALPRSYFDYESEHDRRSVFTTAFLLLIAGALAQVVIGAVGGEAISRLLLQTGRYRIEIFWALLGSALAFINQLFFTHLRFLRRSVASITLSLLALAGSIGISLYLLHGDQQNLLAPFKGVAFAQAAVAIVFLLVYGRSAFSISLKQSEVSVLMAFGIPAIFASLGGMAIDWSDRIFIERMLTLKDVGVYSAGYRLGSVVNTLIVTPFAQIWNPMMFEYRFHKNLDEFFSRIVSYYFLASSVVLIGACLFVRNVLPLVAKSSDYRSAAPVILLVMTGYLLLGSTNIISAGLFYERRITRFVVIYYSVALATIASNFYFVPHYGIVGAAITSLMAYATIPVVVYWQARKFFPIRFETWRLSRVSLLVAGSLFFGLFVDVRYPVPLTAKCALLVVLMALAAVVCTDDKEKLRVRWLLERRMARHS